MKLNEVVLWGRTLGEYKLMFDLSKADLNSKIIGCGDGPASFNAEMTELGHSVVSIDPVYQFSAKQINSEFKKLTSQSSHRLSKMQTATFGRTFALQMNSVVPVLPQ